MKEKNSIVAALCLLLLTILSSCSTSKSDGGADAQIQEKTDFALNTVVTIKLYEADPFSEEAWKDTFDILRDVEAKMSSHKEGTEIMRINEKAGLAPVKVSDDTFEVVKAAKEIAAETKGAFDPSIGSVSRLWQIGSDAQRVPSREEIEEALQKVNYENIVLDESEKTVFLKEEGMALDLGGIAKGYSADKVYAHLSERGVKKAILDFGGNISLIGAKNDSDGWRVGIRKPDREHFVVYASLLAKNESVVSSGDYERHFEEAGKTYHHILDPFTGYPTENGIRGASVILPSSMRADAYATALIVMGKEDAVRFIRDRELEAILIYDNFESYQSLEEARSYRKEN